MNPIDFLKPTRFTYTSPAVPKAAASKPQEATAVPGLASPTQMGEQLLHQGQGNVNLQSRAQREGIKNALYGRRQLEPLQFREARNASGLRVDENRQNLTNLTDNSLRLGDQSYQQGRAIADRFGGLQRGTTSAVGQAITGEQGNDAARLQLMRDVLMKPKGFTETLAELTGAIAPIVSLFV